jgi:gentisate 1,2-dioxygenase
MIRGPTAAAASSSRIRRRKIFRDFAALELAHASLTAPRRGIENDLPASAFCFVTGREFTRAARDAKSIAALAAAEGRSMETGTLPEQPQLKEAREAFYAELAKKNSRPLWELMSSLISPAPVDRSRPAVWRYSEMRPLIAEAARLITAEEAERRVLVLENPGLPGSAQVTQSLYAGLQMIAPGEVARSHRHVASALRYVMEGSGAYTAVNGERAVMRPGDFILTPSWKFHDHGNLGGDDVVWLDGLDIAMVNFFAASFAERGPGDQQAVTKPAGDAVHRFGMGLMPLEYQCDSSSSPVFVYPFERSLAALKHLAASGELNPWHGVKLQFSNPATGGYPMPTIAAFLQWLPAGFAGQACRATDATVYCVNSGRGHSIIGDEEICWTQNDVFVAPSWRFVRHRAESESILFSFSDRAAQKALGLWREEHRND